MNTFPTSHGVLRMRRSLATRLFTAALILPLFAACSENNNGTTMTGPDGTTVRVYSQVERLGNPLVSEVFFAKRDHGLHNTTAPATDISNGFRTKIKSFTDAFNRGNTIGTTLGAVLVPDMLMVYPNRAATTSGWLSWATHWAHPPPSKYRVHGLRPHPRCERCGWCVL